MDIEVHFFGCLCIMELISARKVELCASYVVVHRSSEGSDERWTGYNRTGRCVPFAKLRSCIDCLWAEELATDHLSAYFRFFANSPLTIVVSFDAI